LDNHDLLDFLCATVNCPKNFSLLSPTASAGNILAITTPEGFLSTSGVNSSGLKYIDGAFLPSSGDHNYISSNGEFFSFEAKAEKSGSGEISFDPVGVGATLANPSPPPQSIDVMPRVTGLAFRIETPEPSVWAMLIAVGVAASGCYLKRYGLRG
jgi:hypothetical protein